MDELFRQLEHQIQIGNTEAVLQYLNGLQRLSGTPLTAWSQILHKLVRSLYSENGVEYITVSTALDMIRILYGESVASDVSLKIESSENRFYLDNEGFPKVCQLLELEYTCSVCQELINDPEAINFCYLCDQFFCTDVTCAEHDSQCRKCTLKPNETLCPGCNQPTETLRFCNICRQYFCLNCIATLDPITGAEIAEPDRTSCEGCYSLTYSQFMNEQGLCEACTHPLHYDDPCPFTTDQGICGCYV